MVLRKYCGFVRQMEDVLYCPLQKSVNRKDLVTAHIATKYAYCNSHIAAIIALNSINEYKSVKFKEYAKREGINITYSAPYILFLAHRVSNFFSRGASTIQYLV